MRTLPNTFSTTMLALLLVLVWNISIGQSSTSSTNMTTAKHSKVSSCSDSCKAKNTSGELSCKLSTPQLIKRKEKVLSSLKKQILETKELMDGYAFRFPGTDKVLDELNEFIKTERTCCDFFVFGLSISGDKSEAWLELTGPEGAKDFISVELGLTK